MLRVRVFVTTAPQDGAERNPSRQRRQKREGKVFLLCKNYASHLPKPKLPNREATTSLAATRTTKAWPWRNRMQQCRRRWRQWKARSKKWISKTLSYSKSRLDFAVRARLKLCELLQSRGGSPEQHIGTDVARGYEGVE